MSKLKSLALAALTVALFAVFAGPAAARDRNHDRIPDRWEKRHHLSLKVNQARRDQDKDGLRNRAEFKAGMDPRDADSDNDGVEDGNENAGTIDSFDAATGKLTIKLFGGDTASGLVDSNTEIECDDSAARSSSGGDDNPGGDGQQGDNQGDNNDNQGDNNDEQGDDDNEQGDNNDEQGDDDNEQGDDDNNSSCGTDALTAGRTVKEAELKLSNGKATFEKVELK